MMKSRKYVKALKIGALIAGSILIIMALFFGNAFFGNPISKHLAKKSAVNYVEEKYEGRGYVLKDVGYNFKYSSYEAQFEKPATLDYHFTVTLDSWGNVTYDGYNSIKDGANTATRLMLEYREHTDPVTHSLESEETGTFAFGDLAIGDPSAEPIAAQPLPLLEQSELVPDEQYDINQLGEKYGVIIWVVRDENVSYEHTKDLLLKLKSSMDSHGIAFAGVDFSLDTPTQNSSEDEGIYINSIYYDQIEDTPGFVRLLEDLHVEQMRIYEQIDKKGT